MLPLIKYANTLYDYRNTSVWSAPECLQSPKKVLDPTKEQDVYSFGMVLWELWHEQIPFDNDVAMAIKYVLEEDSRPMIQSDLEGGKCSTEMANIIRLCWQTDKHSRATYLRICDSLKKLQQ